MIIREVTLWDMLSDRQLNEVFTIPAIEKLYDIFSDYSDCCENKVWDYDAVGIRCEYREETPDEIRSAYSNIDEINNTESTEDLIEILSYHTSCYELDNGNILYVEF